MNTPFYEDTTTAHDDMRVLNILVETVRGLQPVSGSVEELAVAVDDYDVEF
jgi:hypothetical protein